MKFVSQDVICLLVVSCVRLHTDLFLPLEPFNLHQVGPTPVHVAVAPGNLLQLETQPLGRLTCHWQSHWR